MDDIRKKLLAAVERMPAFPKSVQKVLTLASDYNCSPRDLVEVIKHDPIFTLKILKVVNSPYIGLANKINSITQASVYLGLNTLKNLALNLATIGALPRENKADFDMNGFWLHSLATALCSQLIGEHVGVSRDELEDFFSAGLLHDVGKVVFALYMPIEFKMALKSSKEFQETLHEAEAQGIGATHAEIGAMLAEKWELAPVLVTAIAGHHSPYGDDIPLIVDCVFAANQVCKRLGFGFAGEHVVEELPADMRERLGMDLDGIMGTLPDLERELSRASILINT